MSRKTMHQRHSVLSYGNAIYKNGILQTRSKQFAGCIYDTIINSCDFSGANFHNYAESI